MKTENESKSSDDYNFPNFEVYRFKTLIALERKLMELHCKVFQGYPLSKYDVERDRLLRLQSSLLPDIDLN